MQFDTISCKYKTHTVIKVEFPPDKQFFSEIVVILKNCSEFLIFGPEMYRKFDFDCNSDF